MSEPSCIGVVGIGKLGLPLALCIEKAGFNVIGMDNREDYIKQLQDKTYTSPEPYVNEYIREASRFRATSSLKEVAERCDVIFYLIVTPAYGEAKYSTTHLESSLRELAAMRISNKHIIIGCTVWPGFFSKFNLFDGLKNVTLSYNPENVAIGDCINGFRKAPILLIGTESDAAADVITGIHRRVCPKMPVVHRMSPASAEITKLAINCYVTTKISFSNMIGDIADRSPGANAADILKCVGSDPRVGSLCLQAGYGYGGPCFYRDNVALCSHAADVGIDARVSTATDEYNVLHNDYQVQTILKTKPRTYTMEEVTYKKGVNILEESQALIVAEKLVKSGVKVTIVEKPPVIQELKNKYPQGFFTYRVLQG